MSAKKTGKWKKAVVKMEESGSEEKMAVLEEREETERKEED